MAARCINGSAIYGGDSGVARRLEAARLAREEFERTGTATYVAVYDPHDPDAAMFFPLDYYGSNEFARRSGMDEPLRRDVVDRLVDL